VKESKEDRIMYENSHAMNNRDRAELISKGLLHLEKPDNNIEIEQELSFQNELQNSNKAYQFIIQFSAFKPPIDINDYNLIPNKLYLKFSILEHENIKTENIVINKPIENSIIPSNMPLVLSKETNSMSSELGKIILSYKI